MGFSSGAVNFFWDFWFISIFIFLISIYSTWIFAHEFHTCGLCWQSHRNDKTYSPGSSDFGISTKSLKAHWSRPVPLLGRLTLAHSDPWGVVPVVVLTNSIGIHPSSWKYSSFGCQYIQVVIPEKKLKFSSLVGVWIMIFQRVLNHLIYFYTLDFTF